MCLAIFHRCRVGRSSRVHAAYAWETDFLLAYEATAGEVKDFLLRSFLPHENERLAFEKILSSRALRARLELEFNGAVPFEEFEILKADDYCRVAGRFRSDRDTRGMVPFHTITATKKHLKSHIRVPGLLDPVRFFAPLLELASLNSCFGFSGKD